MSRTLDVPGSAEKYLAFLQKEIHTAAFATLGPDGHPQVRIIDVMLADERSVYFITARGKLFHRQIVEQAYVAVMGTTPDKRAVSLYGKVRKTEPDLLGEVFRENPYMAGIYPGETRSALDVFQIYEGCGEYFDLSVKPVFREGFVFGGAVAVATGFVITGSCTACGKCRESCPQSCIEAGLPFVIRQEHCLYCGRCEAVCPAGAVERL